MCKPSTGEPLVYTTKNVSFTSDLYSITLKPANIEYVILHTFFLFVITGDAHEIFDLLSMHITEEKGWQEVQKANTNQDEHPLTLVAMSSRSSIFLSISCERDLAPSPAPTRHNFRKNRYLRQFGGEIRTAIQETGKGVTFGGIKQGGVELLLPPQQIRARHGWGNLLSHTSQSRGPVTAARVDAVPSGRAAQRRLEWKVGPGVGGREIS